MGRISRKRGKTYQRFTYVGGNDEEKIIIVLTLLMLSIIGITGFGINVKQNVFVQLI